MRIDIGNNIFYISDFSSNTLPRLSENYESIHLITGRGQFIEGAFKFDSDRVLFNIKVNGVVIVDVDVRDLRDFYRTDDDSTFQLTSIAYDRDNRILVIRMPMPIQYNDSIEFLAKTNDGNKTKKLKGYQIIVNKEVE